ncbi:MAG: hypothetical protein V1926_01565 [Candidatus Peregrinibacteria bacterium]
MFKVTVRDAVVGLACFFCGAVADELFHGRVIGGITNGVVLTAVALSMLAIVAVLVDIRRSRRKKRR